MLAGGCRRLPAQPKQGIPLCKSGFLALLAGSDACAQVGLWQVRTLPGAPL
jgi:hypothetical protein